MESLLLACAAFLATHFVPSTPLRGVLVRALGQWGYVAAYSLVAFAAIGWMSWAYVRAPLVPLWPGFHLLPAMLMPFAFVLLACGLFARNPTIVGAEKLMRSADPARGIIRITRHPIMWAFVIWAVAHLLARGDLKSVIFFGTFAALAGGGMLLMDARKAKALGEDWLHFAAVTSLVPFGAVARGSNRVGAREIGWRNPAIGLALYALFLWFHPALFGARAY